MAPLFRSRCPTALVWLLGFCMLLAGCGTGSGPTRPKLRLLHSRWQDGKALALAAGVIAEDRLGFDVEVVQSDFETGLQDVAAGRADVFMTLWLPETNRTQLAKYGADLADMGPAFVGTQTGLVAPLDLPVDTIADLRRVSEEIEGQILTIEPDSGLHRNAVKAMEAYNLELKVVPMGTKALFKELTKGQAEGRTQVFTGWLPHWMFARWRLKFLADPEGVFGAKERLHPVTPSDLPQRKPRAAALLRGLEFDEAGFDSLLETLQHTEDQTPEETVRQWLASEPDLVEAWLKDVPPAP